MLKTWLRLGILLLSTLDQGSVARGAAPPPLRAAQMHEIYTNSCTTKNFIVIAPTTAIAERVGQWAEYYRKEKANLWLGKEMPTWGQRCPLKVTFTFNGNGGATSFEFDRGSILSIDMHIEGTLHQLVEYVLPHEVTHTVFAYYFRQPVPRWADEGGSVLSEDAKERARHDKLAREILNTPGRAIPLRRLFAMTEYPRDVMVLYAQGYSVTNFLVKASDRKTFLAFVKQGQNEGWDKAVKAHYKYATVAELEKAWLASLKKTLKQKKPRPLEGEPADRTKRKAAS